MPVYNQERYIATAIQSVLEQTYSSFEFIIVDDGSTDRTTEIIESFSDERIRLIRAPHAGFIAAISRGVAEATGKWIARMDSDDVSRTDRLQRQLEFLDSHSECIFVTTYYGIVTPNNKYLTPRESSAWQYLDATDISLTRKLFCDPGTVFNRSLALQCSYDSDLPWEKTLWYQLLEKGCGAVMEAPLYFVRWRLGSVSRGQNLYPTDMGNQIRLKYDRQNALLAAKKASSDIDVRNEKKCVFYYSVAGDDIAARKVAIRAWMRFPLRLETIKLLLIAFKVRPVSRIGLNAGVRLYPVEPRQLQGKKAGEVEAS